MILIRLVKEQWNRLRVADMTQNYGMTDETLFLHMELRSAKSVVKS